MRILMLSQSYAPIVGGEERVVADLSRELADRGHEVSVATLEQRDGGPADDGPVRVHALSSSSYRLGAVDRDAERRHSPPAPDPDTVAGLREVLRRDRPEVVHAHNWIVYSYLPLDRRRGPSLLLSLHDYGLICATKRLFYRGAPCSGPALAKCLGCASRHYGLPRGLVAAGGTLTLAPQLQRQVDVFLPVSGAVEDLCRLGPGDRSIVIPNFVRDLPSAPAPDPRLEQLPDEPFFLYLGDVTEDKGAWHLAETYRMLKDPLPLVMIGRCQLPELKGKPGLHVLGAWPYELAIEALRRSMFSVAPSVWPEPFGLVALEAAAAGKPVVASRIGGLTDIVADGETGLLVAPGDREALRSAVQALIDDDVLRERLGNAARRRANAFSSERIVPRFEEAYELAIEARRPRVAATAN